MRREVKVMTLAALFVLLLAAAVSLRPFGGPVETGMDDHFILNGQGETGCNNMVTSVVFDYRGMDTLGEATVLFAAVTGILVVLGRERDD